MFQNKNNSCSYLSILIIISNLSQISDIDSINKKRGRNAFPQRKFLEDSSDAVLDPINSICRFFFTGWYKIGEVNFQSNYTGEK